MKLKGSSKSKLHLLTLTAIMVCSHNDRVILSYYCCLNTGEMQDLYKLAVLLFIYYSTVDVLLHCSPAIAMSKWPSFCCLHGMN